MKRLKIIPSILGLCLTLNVTGAATEPLLEQKMRETVLTHSVSIEKDVPKVLDNFKTYLESGKITCKGEDTYDLDLVKTVAKYLTYYIYTLYPRGISMDERRELIHFVENNLVKHGLPPNFKNEFFRALESAPMGPQRLYFSEGKKPHVQSCDNAIQLLALSPTLGISFVTEIFTNKLPEPTKEYCSGVCELVKSFTYFVYSLYSRPLPTEDIIMLNGMYNTFNSLGAPSASVIELQNAIQYIPLRSTI